MLFSAFDLLLHFPNFGRKNVQELPPTDPHIPRARRPPKKYNVAQSHVHSVPRKIIIVLSCTFSSPKDYYTSVRTAYFDIADRINGEIQKRFNQQNFYLYAKCEELLILAASRWCVITKNLEAVKKYFGDNLHASRLSNQLAVLSDAV